MGTSPLLINETPLQALPSLAQLIGINGAIILQQIHWWLRFSEHTIEGETWVYNSYDKWAKQFKWLTPRAIQKHILELEKSGYLISRQFKYKSRSNAKWYRIDYDRLDEDCENIHSVGEKSNSDRENIHSVGTLFSQSSNLSQAPKNTQKNTQENTQKILAALQSLPKWTKDMKADSQWLFDFQSEFPEVCLTHVKACRDYWDGKATKHKGQWKTRLRNWLQHERKFASPHRQPGLLPTGDELERQFSEKGLDTGGT